MVENKRFIPDLEFIESLRDLAKKGYVYQCSNIQPKKCIEFKICLSRSNNTSMKKIEPKDLVFNEFIDFIKQGALRAKCFTKRQRIKFSIDLIAALNICRNIIPKIPKDKNKTKTIEKSVEKIDKNCEDECADSFDGEYGDYEKHYI